MEKKQLSDEECAKLEGKSLFFADRQGIVTLDRLTQQQRDELQKMKDTQFGFLESIEVTMRFKGCELVTGCITKDRPFAPNKSFLHLTQAFRADRDPIKALVALIIRGCEFLESKEGRQMYLEYFEEWPFE